MALPCSIDDEDDDDKLDAVDFARWILICDSYLMKPKHLLAVNHHILSNLQVFFLIPWKLPQALDTVFKEGDETVLRTHGGVHATNSKEGVEQVFQVTSNQKANICDNDTSKELELHNRAYVVMAALARDWIF